MLVKTIIAGSRALSAGDVFNIHYYLDKNPVHITEVVSGGARGADSIGEMWAEWNFIPVKLFPAEWQRHGRSAGYRRNVDMADYADALIAFWDGESVGTKHMIDTAKAKDLLVSVYKIEGIK